MHALSCHYRPLFLSPVPISSVKKPLQTTAKDEYLLSGRMQSVENLPKRATKQPSVLLDPIDAVAETEAQTRGIA